MTVLKVFCLIILILFDSTLIRLYICRVINNKRIKLDIMKNSELRIRYENGNLNYDLQVLISNQLYYHIEENKNTVDEYWDNLDQEEDGLSELVKLEQV